MIINFRNLMCSGGGGKPAVIEALSVTENGTYNPAEGTDGYAPVEVNVQPALQEKTATTNGEVIADTEFYGLSKVTVNVPEKVFSTEEKTVSIVENGQTIVEKSADKDGMSKVTVDVNVPAPQPVLEPLSVTANGSYIPGAGVDGYSKVDVAVPGGASATALDYGAFGYTQDDPGFIDLQEKWAYTKQKYDEWDPSTWDGSNAYANDKKLVYAPLIDVSNAGIMISFFSGCENLTTVPVLNTKNVGNIGHIFYECKSLTTVPVWDTSKVFDMNDCFYNCEKLTTVPVWDTSNVTNMSSCFGYCEKLTTVPVWDTSKVTNMSGCFSGCENLTTVPIWNTSKVTDMNSCFNYCKSLTTVPVWDTSKVTDMNRCFYGCEKLTTVPVWDFSNVTNMYSCFERCKSLTTIPSNLTTSKVEDMSSMINECSALTEIGEIDCSSVKARQMFQLGYTNSKVSKLGGFKNLKVSLKMAGESWAPVDKLDKQSLMNVINDLGQADPAFEAEPTLTIAATPFALLTPEDIAIATAKGWKVVSQ